MVPHQGTFADVLPWIIFVTACVVAAHHEHTKYQECQIPRCMGCHVFSKQVSINHYIAFETCKSLFLQMRDCNDFISP